jgi:hypothetical protein
MSFKHPFVAIAAVVALATFAPVAAAEHEPYTGPVWAAPGYLPSGDNVAGAAAWDEHARVPVAADEVTEGTASLTRAATFGFSAALLLPALVAAAVITTRKRPTLTGP